MKNEIDFQWKAEYHRGIKTKIETGSCQASCIDRVYMCWQIGIDIGVSISIGADVYTNSDTLGGTVFSEAVPLFFLCF